MLTVLVVLSSVAGLISAIQQRIPGFNVIWFDHFDVPGLETSKWNIYTGAVFNGEQETYTTSASNCGHSGSETLLLAPRKDVST
ncbi:uncharacterized protein BP5553_03281 [Venustampulla echinocandica]|uniref:Uncharacterized protein n=1 Tax=Venustampulla echinocandica TaxID=2656787 RepID=A0A370TTT4_9HELO|nr:uncharacterized protein BP5553_03281 [Venustampulla echinocandica]RDL38941.1 hypothetical protein BP5553_03281 [Venustampulla echinocandica]